MVNIDKAVTKYSYFNFWVGKHSYMNFSGNNEFVSERLQLESICTAFVNLVILPVLITPITKIMILHTMETVQQIDW